MIDLSKIQFATQKDDKEKGVTHFCGMITMGASGKVEDKTAPPMEAIQQSIKETIWNSVYGDLRAPLIELNSAIDRSDTIDGRIAIRVAMSKLTDLLEIKKPVITGNVVTDEIVRQLNSLQARGNTAITGSE